MKIFSLVLVAVLALLICGGCSQESTVVEGKLIGLGHDRISWGGPLDTIIYFEGQTPIYVDTVVKFDMDGRYRITLRRSPRWSSYYTIIKVEKLQGN